jgi:hypothetical protein
MIDYLRLEWRLTRGGWVWLILLLLVILRAVSAIAPSDGWFALLAAAYPLLVAFSALRLLDQERRWRTRPILTASSRSDQAVFVTRFLLLAPPLLAVPFVILTPCNAIFVLAPALLLTAVVLTIAVARSVEWGACIALIWWTASFLAVVSNSSGGRAVTQWLSIVVPSPASMPAPGFTVPAVKIAIAGIVSIVPVVRGKT